MENRTVLILAAMLAGCSSAPSGPLKVTHVVCTSDAGQATPSERASFGGEFCEASLARFLGDNAGLEIHSIVPTTEHHADVYTTATILVVYRAQGAYATAAPKLR